MFSGVIRRSELPEKISGENTHLCLCCEEEDEWKREELNKRKKEGKKRCRSRSSRRKRTEEGIKGKRKKRR